jgi:very-short-patch-repair endonuclease
MSEQGAKDAAIAGMAARQHGVVIVAQLRGAGIDADGTLYRVRIGRLFRVHRGVYAVGHPGLSREGRWMAAVLACGPDAALSHWSAAALWEMLKARPGPVDVAVPGDGGRKRRHGIRVHRSATLRARDVTRRNGIPVTMPARTIDDLRRTAPPDLVRSAIREAEFQRLPLGADVERDGTRSELERRFLALCRRHGLPKPETNTRVAGYEVDFLWREQCLIVELDGYRYHRTRLAFEDDRARDARLKLAGYEVVRFTYLQVMNDPAGVMATVRPLLARTRAFS